MSPAGRGPAAPHAENGRVDTRYDVSGVPRRAAYVAKQCPVRAQWDAIRPCDPLPPARGARAPARAAAAQFEAEIVARLLALHPDARVIPGRSAGRAGGTPRWPRWRPARR